VDVQATLVVLKEMTTYDDGTPFDEWVLDLTLQKRKRKLSLSVNDWKRTAQGLAVYKREGLAGLEAWKLRQEEKVMTWLRLGRADFLNRVEVRTGRKPRKNRAHAKGGRFAQHVQEGLDTFLVQRRIKWHQIPPGIRDKGPIWQEWRLHNLMRLGNTLIEESGIRKKRRSK
jgi:hypothetical protein